MSTQQSFGFDTTHGFLGEEFLLWLWWRWETEGGGFALRGGRFVGVAFDDLIAFAPKHEDETEQTLRHGMPTRAAEARTALRQGHRIARARLILAEGERQWSFVLHGATLTFSGVKAPADAEECESASDRNADRFSNWFALHELVQLLYGVFLEDRVDESFRTETADAIATWMAR